ncbi:MAG: hypothetical protein ACYSW3_00140 [Planctomycetota bacterium]
MSAGAALAAILARPEAVMAIAASLEHFTLRLLRDLGNMTPEELEAFIAEQEQRKADHDRWIAEHMRPPPPPPE